MEETIINEPSLFQTLVSSPTTYIVLLIIVLTIVGLKRDKSSTKCCGSNKTSTPTKPVAKKSAKKVAKKALKKKAPKKAVAKKAVVKRTPKKSGSKN
tara:strand:+ start:224 stop:514 length:291 start_codon:yes stop_codon:yes gene_type:complete